MKTTRLRVRRQRLMAELDRVVAALRELDEMQDGLARVTTLSAPAKKKAKAKKRKAKVARKAPAKRAAKKKRGKRPTAKRAKKMTARLNAKGRKERARQRELFRRGKKRRVEPRQTDIEDFTGRPAQREPSTRARYAKSM